MRTQIHRQDISFWLIASMSVFLLVGLFPSSSEAFSRVPHPGCERVPHHHPEFAPPPPSYRHRCRRRPRRRRHLRQPSFEFKLAQTNIWYQPADGHLVLNFDILGLQSRIPTSRDNSIGLGMKLVKMEGEHWPVSLREGDFWLWNRNWFEFHFSFSHRAWFIRSGWLAGREVIWELPDALAKSIPSQSSNSDFRNSLVSQNPMYMLPNIETGFDLGTVDMSVGAELLTWDLRSYRIHGQIQLSRGGLEVGLKTSYQVDGARFAVSRDEDGTPMDNNRPTDAIWKRRLFETTLQVGFDVATLFPRRARRIVGPIQLVAGVRYRYLLSHSLETVGKKVLFTEPRGEQWAFFGGVKIAFGQGKSYPSMF